MIKILLTTLIATLVINGYAASATYNNVVPLPRSISYQKNAQAFVMDTETEIRFDNDNIDLCRIAKYLQQYVKDMTKLNLAVAEKGIKISKPCILLSVSGRDKDIPDEGYVINVNKKGIVVKGSTAAGVFYGVQTLRKSLPILDSVGLVEFPAVTITDCPRFKYRGMMLDCSRHFFTADFVKKYIDLLALHNMNRFHWHLTDDQGWRIVVEKYPKLAEVGSQRSSTVLGHNSDVLDGVPYGGYYTDDEIRDIVKYAADRFITIIPEIDMPGHMMSALASYPELGCTGGPYTTGQYWGIYKDVLCAGNEKTYDFVKAVLDKVCSLFPGKYIHIGGDECPRERWEKCPKCQAVITRQHLTATDGKSSEALLQGYFTHRVQSYLESKGRKIIGWDELLGCDVDSTATIMSWRGPEPGAKAAELNHDVIMAPNSYAYFDYYQTKDTGTEPPAIGGFVDVARVYSLEPVAPQLTIDARKHIIGVQANLWTEYISVPNQVEYMVLPRMAALSEVQWMQPESKDFDAFKLRLNSLRNIYELNGLTYARHLWPEEFRDKAKQY